MVGSLESDDEKFTLLSQLGVRTIIARLKGVLTLSREQRQSKERLLWYAIRHAPTVDLHFLLEAGQEKMAGQNLDKKCQKCKRPGEVNTQHTAWRLEEPEDTIEAVVDVAADEDYGPSKFLELPTEEERRNCYAAFYQATSNDAVKMGVCGVCAQECNIIADELVKTQLHFIPNGSCLVLTKPHPAHQLFDGKLLEPAGVKFVDAKPIISICCSCHEELKKPSKKPPKYSLANQLWIGPIPWQLQVLTFPEQLLIALLYPHMYVFKLFPKHYHGAQDVSGLQHAMRGNISTYKLNAEGISSMVEGRLMPRPPEILASLISVTFIGLGDLPKSWIHSTFRI